MRNLIFYSSSLWLVLPFHLWCHKVGSVTGGEEQAVSSTKLLGKSKVAYPDRVGISRVVHVEDVTGLQVSVYHLCMATGNALEKEKMPPPTPLSCGVLLHPLAVEVVNSLGDGVEHSTGLSLREELLSEDLVQQLTSFHQLHHQVYVPALIINLTQQHTVLQSACPLTAIAVDKYHLRPSGWWCWDAAHIASGFQFPQRGLSWFYL